jgi:hypothetical protein
VSNHRPSRRSSNAFTPVRFTKPAPKRACAAGSPFTCDDAEGTNGNACRVNGDMTRELSLGPQGRQRRSTATPKSHRHFRGPRFSEGVQPSSEVFAWHIRPVCAASPNKSALLAAQPGSERFRSNPMTIPGECLAQPGWQGLSTHQHEPRCRDEGNYLSSFARSFGYLRCVPRRVCLLSSMSEDSSQGHLC